MRRALVTGSSRGIGKAIALDLARQGFAVTVHCRSAAEAALQTIEDIEAAGGAASLLRFDLSEPEACRSTLEEDLAERGSYHAVVLNAGVARDAQFIDLTPDAWAEVVDTNLGGFFHLLQPIVRSMTTERIKGRIVALSSVSGILGNQGQVNYSASKAGIIGAVKALSRELARRGITVNCVAPGLIRTEMLEGLPLERIVQMVPMRRLGRPEEVAAVVSFLCSDAAGYVTGQVISVNGGMI